MLGQPGNKRVSRAKSGFMLTKFRLKRKKEEIQHHLLSDTQFKQLFPTNHGVVTNLATALAKR